MNTHIAVACANAAAEIAPPLSVVLTFDDRQNGTTARKLLDKLLFKCADEVDVHFDEWPAHELDHPHCRAEASELARCCDIFAIAAATVSEPFVEFVMDWLSSKTEPDAALVLIQAGTACPAAEEFSRLRELAATAGVTCFWTILPGSSNDPIRNLARNLRSMLASAPETSPIND